MAGNATLLLQVGQYPSGIDRTERSIVLKGNVVPVVTSGTIYTITAFSLTSNVLTLTANNALTTGGGQVINVSGFPVAYAYLNGTYTTTSATSTTIVVPLTHANVALTTLVGIATLTPTYTTGGVPLSFAFINYKGVATSVAGIGPLATPKWIDIKTVTGSLVRYVTNETVSPILVAVYSGITQATDAAAIPFDTAHFRAEFTNGAF
jgi:hypothetical protein